MGNSRLSNLARILHLVSVLALFALPAIFGLVLYWVAIDPSLFPLPDDAADKPYFGASVMVGLLPLALLMWPLNQLRKLFASYRDGEILTEGSARLILAAGKGLAWVALLGIAVQPVQSALASYDGDGGQVAISIGTAEVGFLFVAGLLTLVGWAMAEAARQAEENRSFV